MVFGPVDFEAAVRPPLPEALAPDRAEFDERFDPEPAERFDAVVDERLDVEPELVEDFDDPDLEPRAVAEAFAEPDFALAALLLDELDFGFAVPLLDPPDFGFAAVLLDPPDFALAAVVLDEPDFGFAAVLFDPPDFGFAPDPARVEDPDFERVEDPDFDPVEEAAFDDPLARADFAPPDPDPADLEPPDRAEAVDFEAPFLLAAERAPDDELALVALAFEREDFAPPEPFPALADDPFELVFEDLVASAMIISPFDEPRPCSPQDSCVCADGYPLGAGPDPSRPRSTPTLQRPLSDQPPRTGSARPDPSDDGSGIDRCRLGRSDTRPAVRPAPG